MSFKFNPFTGELEAVGVQVVSEKVFTAIDEIHVQQNGEFFLEMNAEALIKDNKSENVQKIIENVTIKANGELEINNNSSIEVINV